MARKTLFLFVCLFLTASSPSGHSSASDPVSGDSLTRTDEKFDQLASGLSPAEKAELERVLETWVLVKRHRLEKKAEDAAMANGAVKGLLDALGDKHAYWLSTEHLREEMTGTISGIGAIVSSHDGLPFVREVVPNSPSAKAGLKRLDQIVEVDGKPTRCVPLNTVVDWIRGKSGTKVTLKLASLPAGEPRVVIVTRDKVKNDELKIKMLDLDGRRVAYIQLKSFTGELALFGGLGWQTKMFDVAMREPKAVILDLRGNPGGSLEMAVTVVSDWIGSRLVATTEYGDGREHEEHYREKAQMIFAGLPTIVLVNQGSASASEVTVAALQDHGAATIVGEKTYGKGVGQIRRPLGDGSQILFTEFRWLSPKGRAIEDKGIVPDVVVPMAFEDELAGRDPQLDKAKEILAAKLTAASDTGPKKPKKR